LSQIKKHLSTNYLRKKSLSETEKQTGLTNVKSPFKTNKNKRTYQCTVVV